MTNGPNGRSSFGSVVAITIAAAMMSGCPVALSDDFVVAGDGGEPLATGGSANNCPAATPIGGQCPEEVCTGGCLVGGICLISCTAEKNCQGKREACPVGFACRVDCNGDQSCQNFALTCPSDQSCDISCTGVGACTGATFTCKNGPCSISCNSSDACRDATVSCSPGEACGASCAAGSAHPKLNNCAAACDCQPC